MVLVMKIDDKILQVLSDTQSHGEWDIAYHLYGWTTENRSKHGAWIRSIVQALWRLQEKGMLVISGKVMAKVCLVIEYGLEAEIMTKYELKRNKRQRNRISTRKRLSNLIWTQAEESVRRIR